MKTIVRKIAMALAAVMVLPFSALCLPASAAEQTPVEVMKNNPELVGISVYSAANGSGYENFAGHFQWDLVITKSVLDMTANAGTSANPYYFDVYYRIAGTNGEYKLTTCDLKKGGCVYDFLNGTVIYRLFMSDGGFTRLSKAEYEYVIVIRKNNDIVGWEKVWSTWNDKTDNAYTAFIGSSPRQYAVTFRVGDTSKVVGCGAGTVPAYIGDLHRPGYSFAGWTDGRQLYAGLLPEVTGNCSYTAVYRSDYPDLTKGDANGDRLVSIKDVTATLGNIGSGAPIDDASANLNGDSVINIADVTGILTLLANENTAVQTDPVTAALQGKTALFCGDSITAASVYDTDHIRWGWGGRIADKYGLGSFKNAGIDGASFSTCRPTNRIVTQIKNNASGKYDFVILHGGTNDGWDSAAVGSMTAADCFDVSKFDTSTYAGGLEEAFYYAKKLYPDSKLGYIVNYRFNPGVGVGRMGDMEPYYTVGKQICEKWGIPYVSLFDNEEIYETLAPGRRAATFGDNGIHPNSMGYDILYPYIAAFMAEIAE